MAEKGVAVWTCHRCGCGLVLPPDKLNDGEYIRERMAACTKRACTPNHLVDPTNEALNQRLVQLTLRASSKFAN